jgi:hypothetical protein
MTQSLNSIFSINGTNYGYWKFCIRFFLKSIDVWQIVETDWTKPEAKTAELSIVQNNAQLSNDKALHALYQTLLPFEFSRISNYESAKKSWQILETTYEGTKLVLNLPSSRCWFLDLKKIRC